MTDHESVFSLGDDFKPGELSGTVKLDESEAYYEQLFAEALEDGVITTVERAGLDKAAESMGLDLQRLRQLESALRAAYEMRHGVQVEEAKSVFPVSERPRDSVSPVQPASDQRTLALQRRVAQLEARIKELEGELEQAREQVAVEVDLSHFDANRGDETADPAALYRQLRHDPRNSDTLHTLYRAFESRNDADGQWRAAHALVFLGAANEEESAWHQQHRPVGLISPSSSLSAQAWRRWLYHPDEEILTGEIFSVIVPAVLLGRVATLRHTGQLPQLNAERRQDPNTSTVQAVRCLSWAGASLGLQLPQIYADPERTGGAEMIPGVPPATALGRAVLSGRTPEELAFISGRHLCWYRQERFARALVPSIVDLEDLFLAALTIGNPGIPLKTDVKSRIEPLARAIEPLLEPAQIDHLRGQFLRFVEEGGRTNLQRWASACDYTANRAGLLLGNDLRVAQSVLEASGASHIDEQMDDLLVFVCSDRFAKLRQQLGVAIEEH